MFDLSLKDTRIIHSMVKIDFKYIEVSKRSVLSPQA